MTDRPTRPLSQLATEPTFRTIDGVAIRFVESDREMRTRCCSVRGPRVCRPTKQYGRDWRKRHRLSRSIFLSVAAPSEKTH